MKILLELFQGMLLQIASLNTPTGDVFAAGEWLTRYLFREYHQALDVEPNSWEKVRRDLHYQIKTPRGLPPFPGVILLHGSSPAFSQSMMKRSEILLANGYAVMIVNSFTRSRCLENYFGEAEPPDKYKVLCNVPRTFSDQIPAVMASYIDRVTKGYTLLPAERTQDLFAALEVIRGDIRVDAGRLSIIGYSHGGSVVLEALSLARAGQPPPGLDTLPENVLDGVNATVVYYPSCQPSTYYRWFESIASIPTLMIQANQDEYVTPYFCRDTANIINYRSGKQMIEVLSFQNKHAFDMREYPEAFDPVNAEKATEKTLTFIRKNSNACPVPHKMALFQWQIHQQLTYNILWNPFF
ncbi:MAG: dienelactone hydrolase family protein [Endozoicomonas sp.]